MSSWKHENHRMWPRKITYKNSPSRNIQHSTIHLSLKSVYCTFKTSKRNWWLGQSFLGEKKKKSSIIKRSTLDFSANYNRTPLSVLNFNIIIIFSVKGILMIDITLQAILSFFFPLFTSSISLLIFFFTSNFFAPIWTVFPFSYMNIQNTRDL